MTIPDAAVQDRALVGTHSAHGTNVTVTAEDLEVPNFVGLVFDADTTISAVTPVQGYTIGGISGHTYPSGYLPWQFTSITFTGSITLILGA